MQSFTVLWATFHTILCKRVAIVSASLEIDI